jgi:anti-anti-sigma regulatory factor
MNPEIQAVLMNIIQNDASELIERWSHFFDDNEREIQSRYYDDFLGFFEECVKESLDTSKESAETMMMFLTKLYEILGEDYFFNFKNSVYTCYLKFPIYYILDKRDVFHYSVAASLTTFFESMTSRLMIKILEKKREVTQAATRELEEREAPISEIWDGVLMVTIVGTLDSNRVLVIIDKILHRLEGGLINHVIIDINAIFDMNSEIANQIIKLSNAIHFMGAQAYISGVNANIAKNLTHLAISLGDVKTFGSVKAAMKRIHIENSAS